MKDTIEKLQKSIIVKYGIALSIIALLSTLAFYTLGSALKESHHTAEIVNISGKQRMLSQHIALNIYRIHNKLFITHTNEDKHEIYYELRENIAEMENANKKLSTGNLSDDNSYMLSSKIKEMYFGDMNLSARVHEYVSLASEVSMNSTHKDIDSLLLKIDVLSKNILVDLDKVVKQYEKEGTEKLSKMYFMETTAWITTILILLLEIIFIFQPLTRKIVTLEMDNNATMQHLEDTVALRTLHLKELNNQLSNLAFHDPLTGLKNRLNLERDIELALEKSKEHHSAFALLMLDIDWFKKVNDEYGHDVGDMVLKEVSSILQSSVRDNDKVYRAGGEEFVILLNRVSYENAVKIAQQIRSLVEKHVFSIENKQFSKTVSGGIYHSSVCDADDVAQVLKFADEALYKAKTGGRNRIVSSSDRSAMAILDKKYTPSATLTFADKKFNKLINVKLENNINLCYDPEKLLKNEEHFANKIYKEDLELLLNAPKNSTKENPYSTTIRVKNENNEVSIYRVELYEVNDTTLLYMQESLSLAENISDRVLIQNLHAMLENTNDFIYFKDRYHAFTGASKTLVSITSAMSREELIGKTDYELFDRNLADTYFKLEREVFDKKLSVSQELQPIVDNNGNKGIVDNRKYPIHDELGNIIGLFGIARVVKDSN